MSLCPCLVYGLHETEKKKKITFFNKSQLVPYMHTGNHKGKEATVVWYMHIPEEKKKRQFFPQKPPRN